ncbi:hypothetical protein HanPSC8_Chr12g0531851 [Helianthus annuus]|nr:hypothetical protein HanPSC8_Chr12g0531851 [Helianthus annuus]
MCQHGYLTWEARIKVLHGRAKASYNKAAPYRTRTLFSVESQNYFDWQTVGLIYSFGTRQPCPIELQCT